MLPYEQVYVKEEEGDRDKQGDGVNPFPTQSIGL